MVRSYKGAGHATFLTTYSQRCVELLRADSNVCTTLVVLRDLVHTLIFNAHASATSPSPPMATTGPASPPKQPSDGPRPHVVIDQLEQQFHIMELAMSNLEAVAAKRRARAASAAAVQGGVSQRAAAGGPSGDDWAVVMAYEEFLLYLATHGGTFDWTKVSPMNILALFCLRSLNAPCRHCHTILSFHVFSFMSFPSNVFHAVCSGTAGLDGVDRCDLEPRTRYSLHLGKAHAGRPWLHR